MERTVMIGSEALVLTPGGEPALTGRALTLAQRNAIYDAFLEMGHTPDPMWVTYSLNTRLVTPDLRTLYASGRP